MSKITIDVVPQDNVDVRQTDRFTEVLLFKNAVEKTVETENGQNKTVYEVDAVRLIYPKVANITKESIVAHFDYYWNKAIEADVIANKELKINRLKKLLEATDYEAIKYGEGVISQEQYAALAQARAAWRTAINALEQCTTIEQIEAVEFSTSIPKIGA